MLEQLRFSRKQEENHTQFAEASPSSVLEAAGQSSYPPPPSQSRDASRPSRFFPSTPSTLGNVLVPNSSPLSPHETFEMPKRLYTHQFSHDVASASSSNFANGWAQPRISLTLDPLTAPSGFISHGGPAHASLRRQWNGDDQYVQEEGPPRKKVNRRTSDDAFITPESPPSPDVQRTGQRRRIITTGIDATSMSSDDSLQEPSRMLAGPSKPRLTKHRPSPSPDSHAVSETPQDQRFIGFKMTMPTESVARVQAAWNQAGGDVKRATELLSDRSWSPYPVVPTKVEKETLGRVKELDEAFKAQRAALKEKGKKSMIYANRPVLEAKLPSTPLAQKSVIDLRAPSPASPFTPATKVPQRKRAKKLVIDSDSEPDFEDDSDDDRDRKRGRLENTYENRAMEYLNSSASEALQELTGRLSVLKLDRNLNFLLDKAAPENKPRLSYLFDPSNQLTT